MSDAETILQTAVDLGLTVADGHAEGEVEGRRVRVDLTIDRNAITVVFARALLERPLDLGLSLHRREISPMIPTGGMTGDPDLDTELSVHGDDRDRTRAFFTRALCAELLSMHRRALDLRLGDEGCTIVSQSIYVTEQAESWLRNALATAARAATLMEEARAGVPAPHGLSPHVDALFAFADRRHLRWGLSPVLAEGRLDQRWLRVRSVRTGRRRHHLAIRLDFAAELGVGLALHRESLLDALRTALGGQDLKVGDAAFDRRFLIRAEPAQAARASRLFDHAVRGALLDLDHRLGPLVIEDRGLRVDPIPLSADPAAIVAALDTLDEVAGRIEKNLLHGGEETGPYR
ncbi:MAG: hypothetical protein U0359_29580 [Byssovorax sp.]